MLLPRLVDPRKLCTQGVRLQGFMPVAGMDRLQSAVIAAQDQASVTLVFGQDDAHRSILKGVFSLEVELQCQRCLGPVRQGLRGDFEFGLVWDEDRAAALPKHIDPWLVSGDQADLYDLVEDEILLSLPIVAFHDENSCPGRGSYSTGDVEEPRENPFGILAQLKK